MTPTSRTRNNLPVHNLLVQPNVPHLIKVTSPDGEEGSYTLEFEGPIRGAIWEGATGSNEIGDGVNWSDAKNWARYSETVEDDTLPLTTDAVVFPYTEPSQRAVDLQNESHSVRSLYFFADSALHNGTLTLSSGEVNVSPDVTTTMDVDLGPNNLRKTNDGTLISKTNGGTLIIERALADATLRVEEGALYPRAVIDRVEVTPGASLVIDRRSSEFYEDLAFAAGSVLEVSTDGPLGAGGATETITLRTTGELRLPQDGPDGDPDMMIRGHDKSQPTIENHTGFGVFVVTNQYPKDVETVRFNEDSIDLTVYQATAGDTNGDGAFGQLDIVNALQNGKYLTKEQASWTEGDWNHDRVFDQRDIVIARQTGGFEKTI